MLKNIVVFVTCPSREEAAALSELLVNKHLAACVNILGGVTSIFRWQSKVERAEENLLVVKTKETLLPQLTQAIKENHSYEVPEIIALPIIGGSDEYLNWINSETLEI